MRTKRETVLLFPTKERRKHNLKKSLWIGLGIVATAVGTIFGINQFNKRKKNETDIDEITDNSTNSDTIRTASFNSYTPSNISVPVVIRNQFPLKMGSKGDLVKSVQQALISKYGSTILPKYGADGDFGSEMQSALQKIGFPEMIDESTYNVLVKSGANSNTNSIAKRLFTAINGKSQSGVLAALKEINNVPHYIEVGKSFANLHPFSPDKKIAQELLNTFTLDSQRDPIRVQLLRIGLKYDGKTWTLSGLENKIQPLLITIQPTELIDPKHKVKVNVPANMVVGHFLLEKEGLTLFKTIEKNKKLIVKSSTVKIYETD